MVRREFRRQGIARNLVTIFESEVANRGGLTITLGTDDDTGMTLLSDVNLYQDLPRRMAELRALGRNHPFLFYQEDGLYRHRSIAGRKWPRTARHLHVETCSRQ